MRIKIVVLSICVLSMIGCSQDDKAISSSVEDLSREECSKIGGRIIEGIGCAQDIPKDEMRKMCENNGMKYSPDLNGCIE